MKTILILTIAALTGLSGISYAGPSDSAQFAIRAAREAAARDEAANNRIALMRGAENQQNCGQNCSAPAATPQKAQQCCSKH